MKLEVSAQVYRFVAGLAPQPKLQLRKAIEDLAHGRGDIRALEGELADFYRLRVGRYRVIFWYRTVRGHVVLRCEYAEARSIVYELFSIIARQVRP